MIEIRNDIIVKCNRCGKIFNIDKDSLFYETHSYERNMGPEIDTIFYDDIECECGNVISLNLSGYEYPVGAFNYEHIEISNGEYVINPELDVIYWDYDPFFDDYELDYIEELKSKIYNMTSREFEVFISELFEKEGYEVKVTNRTRDGGFDIICKKKRPTKLVLLVECKHYCDGNKVNVQLVRGLYGVHCAQGANQSILVTTSTFTKPARDFANEQKTLIQLMDIDDLVEWITSEE